MIPPLQTYDQALEFLDSFQNYEQTVHYRYPEAFSLDRVRNLLNRLGNPQVAYPSIHVAGTKGKGSTCAFAASLLQAAGQRTGLYTSPHLLDLRERFRIDGAPISEKEFVEIVETIRPEAGQGLTFFEVTTACAFLWFARAGVNAAVVEVGLGGRLDATNLLRPKVSVITPISLDHMDKLGNRLAEIAREKAGILKRDVPAVIGPQEKEAADLLRAAGAQVGAPLHWMAEEVRAGELLLSPEGTDLALQTPAASYRNLHLPLLGRHQISNAAAAVRAVELFFERGLAPLGSKGARPLGICVQEGMEATRWPGRCQLVPGRPPLLLDGAQNAASAQALRQTVEELFPGKGVWLIVGSSMEKDLKGMAQVWVPWAKKIFLVKADHPRAESPKRLKEIYQAAGAVCRICASTEEAVEQARKEARPDGLVVVTGSLFIVAEVMKKKQNAVATAG